MASPSFQWTVHPARARPVAAGIAAIAIVAVSVLVANLAGDWWWGAMSALGLFMSLARFFLPTQFRVDDEGAQVAYPLSKSRLAWAEVGCVRWRDRRALIARSSSYRSQVRGIVLEWAESSQHSASDLRAFVNSHTPSEAWV